MKKLKKTKYSPKEIDLSLYPEYEEITGNALFLINGGKHIENSIAAQAEAQPGDTVTNSLGETHELTEADIKWAQEKCGMTGSPANSSSQPPAAGNSSSSSSNSSGPTNSYTPQLQVPDFEDPYKPESDGTFEIDDENKIVSVEVNQNKQINEEQLESLWKAYGAYYILEDRGYSFKIIEGDDVVKTFNNSKDAVLYAQELDPQKGNLMEVLGQISTSTGVVSSTINYIIKNEDISSNVIKLSKYSKNLSTISTLTGILPTAYDIKKFKEKPTFRNFSNLISDATGFIPGAGPFISILNTASKEIISETVNQGTKINSIQIHKNMIANQFINTYNPSSLFLRNIDIENIFLSSFNQGIRNFYTEE